MNSGYRNDRDETNAERELRRENEELQAALEHAQRERPRWSAGALRGLFGGAGIGVVGLLGFLLFSAFTSCVQACKTSIDDESLTSGVVTNKHHRAAYSTTVLVTSGKTQIPITTHYPERWWVVVADDGETDEVPLPNNFWNNVDVGDCWHGARNFSSCTSATNIAGVGL